MVMLAAMAVAHVAKDSRWNTKKAASFALNAGNRQIMRSSYENAKSAVFLYPLRPGLL